MTEGGGEPRLLFKCGDASLIRGEFFAENLQRHLTVQGFVAGDENGTHAANRVAAGQRVRAELLFDPVLCVARRTDYPRVGCHGRHVHWCGAFMALNDLLFVCWHILF